MNSCLVWGFFWPLTAPRSSHTGSPGERAKGQRGSAVLLPVSASPPGWEESGGTGRGEDMDNLLKRGLAAKGSGAAHTNTLLPGLAPLQEQRKKSNCTYSPPIKERNFSYSVICPKVERMESVRALVEQWSLY